MSEGAVRQSAAGRGFRWVWAMGLGVPILGGLVIVALVMMSLYTGGVYQAPVTIDAGNAAAFPVSAPKFFEAQRFWAVKLPSGEILGLYDRDPITGCTVPWDAKYVLNGKAGWFRDACSDSTYDLQGACFSGPCQVGLNRMKVQVENGDIVVYLREQGVRGPARSANGPSLNP